MSRKTMTIFHKNISLLDCHEDFVEKKNIKKLQKERILSP
jgi:hypothetical protein